MTRSQLLVTHGGDRVGVLSKIVPGAYAFEYDDMFRERSHAVPLSTSLPLTRRRHSGAPLFNYLDNLLPDRPEVRDRWATHAGLASSEPFDLLAVHGADVAGAISFHLDGTDLGAGGGVHEVHETDIAQRIRTLREDAAAWSGIAPAGGHFSLGGMQGKFALARTTAGWGEPSGTAPATHIFKPAVGRLPDIDVIEYLMMRTARAIGLPVAKVDLSTFEGERALVVERFDRLHRPDGSVVRTHQEDVLQALGGARLQKYESDGGPGIRSVLSVFDREVSEESTRSKGDFVRALMFFWLVLNTDAHAKNFSIAVLPDGRIPLTPLYDIVSLLPYLRDGPRREIESQVQETRFAMRMMGSFRGGDVTADTWRSVARDAGMDPEAVVRWVRIVAEGLADVVIGEVGELDELHRTEVTGALVRRIRIRTTLAMRALGA